MKKILIGLIIGAIVFIPMGAFAWSQKQMAQPIIGADCEGPYYTNSKGHYTDSHGKELGEYDNPVVNPNGTDGRCSVTIYKFTDSGHTCYVSKGTNAAGIDCL